METLKKITLHRIDKDFIFLATTFVAVSLLGIRLKLTGSFFYLFLLWNLFLAWVPYGISLWAASMKTLSRFRLLIFTGIWLLFLPNAPYIITDFIHLQLSPGLMKVYDLFLILSFALAGLYCYYSSLHKILVLWKPYISSRLIKIIKFGVPFITAFGIYLGRFLRFNSWDILTAPQNLLYKMLEIITQPSQYLNAWLFIFILGVFLLCIFYYLEKRKTSTT